MGTLARAFVQKALQTRTPMIIYKRNITKVLHVIVGNTKDTGVIENLKM